MARGLSPSSVSWSISTGNYLLAIPLALGTFWVIRVGPQRHAANPLTVWQWPTALALYLVAIAVCSVP